MGAVVDPLPLPSFGPYQPVLKLAQGGTADVFLAARCDRNASPPCSRLAVIKQLRATTRRDDDAEWGRRVEAFRADACVAIHLEHPNIARAYELGEHDGTPFVVMEYVDGVSLDSVQRALGRLHRRCLTDVAARIVSDVLAALHHAHEWAGEPVESYGGAEGGLIHGDVSPQNIVVGYDGVVRLVDFSAARAGARRDGQATVQGKARYVAPEQVVAPRVDRRADVYSAGVVLWELIAQQKLVRGASMIEQLVAVTKAAPRRLSSVAPDVALALEAVVHTALERSPEDRYATADAMRAALEPFAAAVHATPGGLGASPAVAEMVGALFVKMREERMAFVRARVASLWPSVPLDPFGPFGAGSPDEASGVHRVDRTPRGSSKSA